ncbi:adenosine deaminase family protein [Schumannella soli]|uniref:Adenosine deaminase domain-containing protein n=1 Tax=Schumannella soli TaxID=2590779 RepID=A0A506Y6G2_9MICO|nr:hypothetical protein [Schumannella soli]TPW77463.1 hypothetical protein FJ657_01915 [Schumannella soli]
MTDTAAHFAADPAQGTPRWPRVRRDDAALEATDRLLAALPKVELHTHLAGNVPEWLFAETARRYGIPLDHPEQPYSFVAGMVGFLKLFDQVADTFRTPDDLYRASYESLVAERQSSRLRYREVHYSPTINPHVGYADAVTAIGEGIEAARRDHGVDGRIVVAIYRNQGPEVAERLVEEMIAHPTAHVVGLGMEADETVGPTPLFHRAYLRARDAGIRVTAHVGERGDVGEVLYAVDELKVDRLDHAYALAFDPGAAAHVADRGLHLASAWASAKVHFPRGIDNPLRTLIDSPLDISISSDDPGINRVTLDSELREAAVELELPDDYLTHQNSAQLDAAWIDDATRAEIRAEIDAALSALEPENQEQQ